MSTNSMIGIKLHNGNIRAIYCHWDGYPSHHLPILKQNYCTPEQVSALLDLGDLSVLDENLGKKIEFDDYALQKENKQCVAYGRDRGEQDTKAEIFHRSELLKHYEYVYIFIPETFTWDVYNISGTKIYEEGVKDA